MDRDDLRPCRFCGTRCDGDVCDEACEHGLRVEQEAREHEPGCPAIADDESDYEHLDDAGICVCRLSQDTDDL